MDYDATGEATREVTRLDQSERRMVTSTETIRPRTTDVFTAYSDAFPSTKYHVEAENALTRNLLGISDDPRETRRVNPRVKSCTLIGSSSDTCAAQYRIQCRNQTVSYVLAHNFGTGTAIASSTTTSRHLNTSTASQESPSVEIKLCTVS